MSKYNPERRAWRHRSYKRAGKAITTQLDAGAPPNSAVTARHGVWTPWSEVLCAVCEYTTLNYWQAITQIYAKRIQTLAAMDRTAKIDQPVSQLLGQCDACRGACWVRADVALLQQVGFKSSELDWEGPFGWELQQTGGMCAALVFSTEGRQIVVTAMDGTLFVGEYAHTDGEPAAWGHAQRSWESAALYADDVMKDVPALGALATECARKAIEFIRNPTEAAA